MGDRVGPPAQEVDVNHRLLSSCSATCCSLAIVLLHFHMGFWQPAEASCPVDLRGSHSSGQKWRAILLWLQPVLTQAVTAAQAVTTVRALVCSRLCFSHHLAVAHEKPTQPEWLIVPLDDHTVAFAC